jgi:hypothetical protein
MGAAGATNEIMKESHSYLEWDFFKFVDTFWMGCFFILEKYNCICWG